MAQGDKVFSGQLASVYDNVMGPIFFEPFARDLAQRVAALKPETVLETAAGSGIATEAIVAARPSAQVTATDLNQAMLEVGRGKPKLANVTWQACDATKLPYGDRSFDVIACQFGAMFFADKISAFKDARRVLKADGHLLFSVWDALAFNPAPAALLDALAKLFPLDPPSFMRRIPHGHYDIAVLTHDLTAAGFKEISATTIALPCNAASPQQLAVALCQGTPTRAEIEAREPEGLQRVTDAIEEALAVKFGNGPIVTTMQAIVFSGTA